MPQQTDIAENRVADIPCSYSRLAARELGLTERQLPSLLRGTGLDVKQLLSEEGLITATQQVRILHNALILSGYPDFGLRLGERLTPATHGAMGFVANSSPDLLTAFRAVRTYLPTRASFVRLDLNETSEQLECLVSFDLPMDIDMERCLAETVVVALAGIAEFIIGAPLVEAEFCFAHLRPEYHAIYSDYLSGRVRFGCGQLMFKLPIALCRVPNATSNHENYRLALQQCESMLVTLQTGKPSYSIRVKKMMLSHPPGMLHEAEAAAALFMTKRSLARKLKDEGSGFRKIRDEILSKQAVDYLCKSRLSIESVAGLLNYHDSASFRRAFKRWFGMPPEKYREQSDSQGMLSAFEQP